MRLFSIISTFASALLLSSCMHTGTDPRDPYENFNRKIHNFNLAFDATMLRPPARLYVAVVPAKVRAGVNNFYNNIYMLPVVANDLLQGQVRYAYKDSWRFFINSTLGIGGILDVAARFGLPYHQNDLGLTFAKWGDKHSPYLVIPFLGPSTFRDGMGMAFEYTLFTPYSYLIGNNDALFYALAGVRYVDLRSQLFETEKLMHEALDSYTFVRDAWLQHRNFLISGETLETGAEYVEE